jgi:hypothetical protein
LPFPLTLPVEKNCPPDPTQPALPYLYGNPENSLHSRFEANYEADLMKHHYAIKGPGNPSAEIVSQTFDHVTEGTTPAQFD